MAKHPLVLKRQGIMERHISSPEEESVWKASPSGSPALGHWKVVPCCLLLGLHHSAAACKSHLNGSVQIKAKLHLILAQCAALHDGNDIDRRFDGADRVSSLAGCAGSLPGKSSQVLAQSC